MRNQGGMRETPLRCFFAGWSWSFSTCKESVGCQYSPSCYSSALISPVVVGLVRSAGGQTQVLGLNGGHLGQFDVQTLQMSTGDLFVQSLGKDVDSDFVGRVFVPQCHLGEDLVGERTRHDPARKRSHR